MTFDISNTYDFWSLIKRQFNLYYEQNGIECELTQARSLARNGVFTQKNLSILKKVLAVCRKWNPKLSMAWSVELWTLQRDIW